MLIDLFLPASDGANVDDVANALGEAKLNGVVLVGEGSVPSADAPLVNALSANGLKVFRGALVDAAGARLWVLPRDPGASVDVAEAPPAGEDEEVTVSATVSHVASSLAEQGHAVLLCNPYARELPGGNFRDYAASVTGIDGVLALVGGAHVQENLLGHELATLRSLAAGGGSGVGADHRRFGSCLTLSLVDADDQASLVDALKGNKVLAVETGRGRLPDIESRGGPPRGDRPRGGRDRDGRGRGGRDRDGRGRGRDRDRGRGGDRDRGGGRGGRRDGGGGRDSNA